MICPRGAVASELCALSRPLNSEGAGKTGCPPAPVGPRAKKSRESAKSTGVGGEHSGLPCAMVLRLIRALLGEPMLVCHRRLAQAFGAHAKLDASVGASGPHDFAVRVCAARQSAHPRPPHPRPAFVTIAIAPLRLGRDGEAYSIDSSFGKSEYFLREGIDRDLRAVVVGQIRWACARHWEVERRAD